MSDLKSKLPDLKELASMSGKLFSGLKSTLVDIVDDYKKKREPVAEATPKKAAEKPTATTAKKKPVAKKSADKVTKKD